MSDHHGAPELTGYDPTQYGRSLGSDYDVLYPGDAGENEAAIALLAEIAEAHPERSVLEFGVGTGRLALALHARGLRVAGIDASQDMVAELQAKPDGAAIDVVIGDYTSARVPGRFGLVVIVFNNVLDPRGLDAQVALFRNAARHLAPGGRFVVEAFVLSEAQRSGDWSIEPRYVGEQHVELQLARYDIETNRIERTLVHLRPEGLHFVTVRDTYASPGELDVIAQMTGFHRVARYAGWSREAFTVTSSKHVSVYQLSD